ncbi:MAG: inovirus-type Gp2 protein [Acidobacteriota bacterium]
MKQKTKLIQSHVNAAHESSSGDIYCGLLNEEELFHIDEEFDPSIEGDSILALMVIERTTQMVVDSSETVCPTSTKHPNLYMNTPCFQSIRHAIDMASAAFKSGKCYSPIPSLFLKHWSKRFAPRSITPTTPNQFIENGILFGKAINEFVEGMRNEYKSESFQDNLKNHRDTYLHRYRRCKKLTIRTFENHSKLCIVRIDLYLGKANNEYLSLKFALGCLRRFLNNQRHNQLFKDRVGYIIKLEFTRRRGFHFHVILIFDGQTKRNADFYANKIGHYWVDTITRGSGSFYNCHKHKNSYKRIGIGLIDWRDKEKITALLYAMSYLAKSDQHLREKDFPTQRAFFTSVIPELRPSRGRPRIDDRAPDPVDVPAIDGDKDQP